MQLNIRGGQRKVRRLARVARSALFLPWRGVLAAARLVGLALRALMFPLRALGWMVEFVVGLAVGLIWD
jgi:hypothetical protein